MSQIDDTSKRDARSIFNFLERVYRWQQPVGWVFFAIRDGERWRELPIDTRKNGDDRHLRMIIDKYAHGYDFYFCPTIFKTDRRKRVYAHPTGLLHCDIDGGDPNAFAQRPSVMWETSPGRYQALWQMDRRLMPHDAEACNRALAQHSEDGTGWEITKYLRVPFTFNFKPEYHRPRVHLLKADFEPLYGWKPERIERTAPVDTEADWDAVRKLDSEWRKIVAKRRAPISSPPMIVNGKPDRSDTWMWIAGVARDNGASDEEIAVILLHCRRTFIDRFPDGLDDPKAREEIERVCSKLRKTK